MEMIVQQNLFSQKFSVEAILNDLHNFKKNYYRIQMRLSRLIS